MNYVCIFMIIGSPYQFYVDEVDSPVVAAYGPGLSYGVAGEPCSFTIDTKNSGAGIVFLQPLQMTVFIVILITFLLLIIILYLILITTGSAILSSLNKKIFCKILVCLSMLQGFSIF